MDFSHCTHVAADEHDFTDVQDVLPCIQTEKDANDFIHACLLFMFVLLTQSCVFINCYALYNHSRTHQYKRVTFPVNVWCSKHRHTPNLTTSNRMHRKKMKKNVLNTTRTHTNTHTYALIAFSTVIAVRRRAALVTCPYPAIGFPMNGLLCHCSCFLLILYRTFMYLPRISSKRKEANLIRGVLPDATVQLLLFVEMIR